MRDKIDEANEILEDILKRITLNGEGILKASKDRDRSRIAPKWTAMHEAVEELSETLSTLHWRHELSPLTNPEDYE